VLSYQSTGECSTTGGVSDDLSVELIGGGDDANQVGLYGRRGRSECCGDGDEEDTKAGIELHGG